MSRAKAWIGFALLAVAALAVALIVRAARPAALAEDEEIVTDVAVHVAAIGRETLHRWVTAYGTVEPEPTSAGRPPARAIVGSPLGGVLAQIDCVEGGRVRAGATLFRLDSRAAEVARARASQQLEFAEITLARQYELLKTGGTSERAVQEAEQRRDAAQSELSAAETQLDLLRITAPLSGTVVRIDARLGQSVDSTSALAEIVDLDRLVVRAGVPSHEASAIRAGQRVELGSGGSIQGAVMFLGRDIDARSDTVPVRVSAPAGAGLQPGALLQVRILADERADCLTVPESSLVTRAGEGSWIVLVEGDHATRQPVTPGLRENGRVEVEGDGLREGLSVVGDEAYSLPAESRIRIVER